MTQRDQTGLLDQSGLTGLGLSRVIDPPGVLPQAAARLDPQSPLGADEVAIAVERLNLDAASYRQLSEDHGGDGAAIRAAVLSIIETRGKMHNPVTGSGGMLIGTVSEVGPESPLGLQVGDRVATLVSLTLTPLLIADRLESWDGLNEQVPCAGRAILFGRSIAARLPDDLAPTEALAVFDVCGAPALAARVINESEQVNPLVTVIGGGGKSGSLVLAVARDLGARSLGVVPTQAEADQLTASGVADQVLLCDARDPIALSAAVQAAGGPSELTVVCADVAGCEGGAILATAPGGTVIFFSMATQFAAAALGAEGVAADLTMIIGNGYTPGHAALALDLYRRYPGVRELFAGRENRHRGQPSPA